MHTEGSSAALQKKSTLVGNLALSSDIKIRYHKTKQQQELEKMRSIL